MSDPVMKIYVADLANQLEEMDNKSIPIGVGFIGAYCRKRFAGRVDVRVFRTFDTFREAVLEAPPEIAGFGCYDWNFNLTLNAAKFVKGINPDCYIVMGGANAEINPNDNCVFLSDHPQIDSVVYGDGEYPFADLVDKLFEHRHSAGLIEAIKKIPIDGVRSLVDGKIVMGCPTNIVRDLEEIPSPYLTGLFDDLLQNPNLMPILQNVRGCPYLCKYCVSGSQSGKVRHFSYDRLVAEVDYLRENSKHRFLRLSDDNFGIIEHDVELGAYIRKSYDEHGYPAGLKAYSAKRLSDRTRRLAMILKPLMLMCISLQTTTPEVLKKTKRTSATETEALENLEFARKNGIATATELIFGLPGETLDSMKDVINTTMDMRFDSIGINVLWLLRGADLYRPEYREENGYRSKFMFAENAITISDEFTSIECDEIAVESKYYSHEDWKRFLAYEFLLKMSYYYGYAREMLIHALNGGIPTTDILDELLDNPDTYPTVTDITARYLDKYLQGMYDSKEELSSYIKKRIKEIDGSQVTVASLSKHRMLYSFINDAFFNDEDHAFLGDFHRAIVKLYHGGERDNFVHTAEELYSISKKMIVYPNKPFEDQIPVEFRYDVSRWIRDGYENPLWDYDLQDDRRFKLVLRNEETVRSAMQQDRMQKRHDNFNFFRYMNTSMMRRIVVKEGEDNPGGPIVGHQQEAHVLA